MFLYKFGALLNDLLLPPPQYIIPDMLKKDDDALLALVRAARIVHIEENVDEYSHRARECYVISVLRKYGRLSEIVKSLLSESLLHF